MQTAVASVNEPLGRERPHRPNFRIEFGCHPSLFWHFVNETDYRWDLFPLLKKNSMVGNILDTALKRLQNKCSINIFTFQALISKFHLKLNRIFL